MAAAETTPLTGRGRNSYKSCDVKRRNTSIGSLDKASRGQSLCGISIPDGFWWIMIWGVLSAGSAIVLVIVHKTLFKFYGFPQLTAQFIEMFAQIIIGVTLGLIFDSGTKPPSEVFWPRFRLHLWSFARLIPLGLIYILRIRTSNGAVANNPISTYQCLRSAAIVFTVGLSWPVLGMKPSIYVIGSCLLIFLGVAVPNMDPSAIPPVGLAWGLAAALSTAVYFILIKYYLPVVGNDSRILSHYNCSVSVIALAPVVLLTGDWRLSLPYFGIGEPAMTNIPGETPVPVELWKVWLIMAICCVMAFLVNIFSMLLVRCSSPVTYDVFSFLKSVIQGYIGYVFFGESKSIASLIGNAFAIVGSFAYGKAKHMEHTAGIKEKAAEQKRLSLERRKLEATNGTNQSGGTRPEVRL